MNVKDLQVIREALHAQPDATHYEGCWQQHGWCAVAYLLPGFIADPISCDTESTEERKFSDLKTEVECLEIDASAISDTLPEYECGDKL